MTITNDDRSDEDVEMEVRMTSAALRSRYIRGQRAPTEGVVCVVAVHNRGRAKELLEEMAASHRAGWVAYGDGSYSITDIEAAKKFIENNGGDLPFGFDD